MRSSFGEDLNVELEISKFIDKNLYPYLSSNFKRYKKKKNQKRGIDVFIQYQSKSMKIDDKCAVYYANKELKTFTFELSYLNEGKENDGWLIKQNMETTHYNIMWLNTKDRNIRNTDIKFEDIKNVESMIISKKRLIDYLERLGYDNCRLKELNNQIRNANSNRRWLSDHIELIISKKLAERPVNLKINKNKLAELAEMHFNVSENQLYDLKNECIFNSVSGSKINQNLTKQQKEIVYYEGSEVLVRGTAGSGKTLVMLRRAMLTAEKFPNQKVAIFTFSKALSNASRLLINSCDLKNLYIKTFHSWAMGSYSKVMKRNYCLTQRSDDILKFAISNLIKTESHRFVLDSEKYKKFLNEEISWMKGKGIESLEDYLESSRRGRGSEVRVTSQDRKLIFKIFEAYNIKKGDKLDFDDFGLTLSKNIDKLSNEVKYDHVFVDEAQDLQQVQLLLLKAIARKSFFVAADKGQKIYKTSFSWSDVGLNIKGGRTKTLKESFRSTKQIIQFANGLQQNDSIINDEEFLQAELPAIIGQLPLVTNSPSKEIQDYEVARVIKKMSEESPVATIGILARENRSYYRIKSVLDDININLDFISQDKGNPHLPGVKFCTFHSAKGLEFDYVIIIDLVESKIEENLDEFWDSERRLLYVAITRAIKHVQLYYLENEPKLLKELDNSLYNKEIL